jgi:thiamine biosynthesis protein ThiS
MGLQACLMSYNLSMVLHINGEEKEFPEGLTLAALLAQLGMKADRIAVELNLEIVARANWDSIFLKTGDKLEIVHFVGGGSGREPGSGTAQMSEAEHISQDEDWNCPTCTAANLSDFCASCGEKRPSPHDLSMGHLLSHASETLFHWDSKIFRTLRVLFTRPGVLSAAYVSGRRKPYVHPFQVFFIANVLYFFLFPVLGWSGLKTPLAIYQTNMGYKGWASRKAAHRAEVKGMSMGEFTQRFDHAADVESRSLVLLMVPLFALAAWVLEWRKRRFFAEHVVFALHFYAFWIISILIVLYGGAFAVLLAWRSLGHAVSFRHLDARLFEVSEIIVAIYLALALRRFYGDSKPAAIIKAVLLAGSTYYVLQAFRFVLFLTALYSA